ncbi:hypothetical protein D3C72_2288820 [compost metagenome]
MAEGEELLVLEVGKVGEHCDPVLAVQAQVLTGHGLEVMLSQVRREVPQAVVLADGRT